MKYRHRKKSFDIGRALGFALCLFLSGSIQAQTWNSNAGGYNGGYGQVYQSFGLAQATINMQNYMKITMQKTIMRMQMEKQFGKQATDRALGSANRQSGSAANNQSRSANPNFSRQSAPNKYAFFTPLPQADNYKTVVETLGETAEEKAFLTKLFAQTKIAFEKEIAPKGRKNNFAAALVFFIASAATVYHDAPEPSETATENLFLALNAVVDETPEMREIPNADKQKLYDTLICFSGLVYAGYLQGKQAQDAEMTGQYQKIAGILLEMILKTSPDKIRFVGDSLQISS